MNLKAPSLSQTIHFSYHSLNWFIFRWKRAPYNNNFVSWKENFIITVNCKKLDSIMDLVYCTIGLCHWTANTHLYFVDVYRHLLQELSSFMTQWLHGWFDKKVTPVRFPAWSGAQRFQNCVCVWRPQGAVFTGLNTHLNFWIRPGEDETWLWWLITKHSVYASEMFNKPILSTSVYDSPALFKNIYKIFTSSN